MKAKVELDLFGRPVEEVAKPTARKATEPVKAIEVASLPHDFVVRKIESSYREVLPDRSIRTTLWH